MNASTYLYVCQHNTEDDAKYMAKKLGVSVQIVPRVPLQFLIKGPVASGHVKFNTHGKPDFLKGGTKRLSISPICGVFGGLSYR